jgi:NADP-dependent 3-hydroxy acid dehydrogenase YdfG
VNSAEAGVTQKDGQANGRERVALISGASRGIGAAVAEELFRQGWNLSLGMRKPNMPDWADPERVVIQPYEVGLPGAEADWVEAAKARFGGIDAIIANAGIMIPKTVIEAEDEDLEALLEINVKAPRRLAKSAWDALAASGRGRVIILASLSGKRVKSARAGLYSVSKFAAVALAHGIRHAGFDLGIRATAICPGFVATDMARGVSGRADEAMTSPHDLARIIALLLDLPNEASVAEFAINCQLEESF